MTALEIIKAKCEQYWNVHDIGAPEIHCILEFIHRQACQAEAEFNQLEDWVNCLEGAGVDNWEGYEFAQEMFTEMQDEIANSLTNPCAELDIPSGEVQPQERRACHPIQEDTAG